MMLALSILAGYLFGSIPFGLVLAHLTGYGDIRKIGSGNIGATNVLRTGNKPLAFLTLVLDSGKGAIAALTAMTLAGDQTAMFAGFAAIVGHMFPVWLKFKGGKGVATTLGTLLAAIPTIGAIACLTWLVMAVIFRISSLSALVAVFITPIAAHYIYADPQISGVCAMIAALVWLKHRANIQRLIKGEEPKIGKKKIK